ncbi:ABC transporter G family member 34-like isoform X1 [Cucumis melo var. makuwa]|uniref:ABC transporter G family member 34-like isoform X1 n=1 Tax=Cucumis melo var. makuwa TaxID=1194695 RepID=A0A5D3DNM3_CUCMM|nr:ABC transporter G family member 34-like isoform X1 [Cucumis melo var. makuwa]
MHEVMASGTDAEACRSSASVDEEEELRWAAIQRLPTYDRVRKGMLREMLENGRVVCEEVDVRKMGFEERKRVMERVVKVVEEDNEKFLRRMRDRIDRVGIEIPKAEVRFENLSVEGDVYVGRRAQPNLLNLTLNAFESLLGLIGLSQSKKKKIQILKDASGIIKPSRMTLLLGHPSSGKTTLLLALAGKLDKNLRESGKVTYCGHEMHEFVPQKTCAYISQHDLHTGEMTVRETLDFSSRCLGVGRRYELLIELMKKEKEVNIKPDLEIDAFMKAISVSGQKTSLVTDYVLKILGLEICADTLVGDDMRRGISGGQKKRLTTGEMLVGPARMLLMDGITTGLDSSTSFQICKFMRQMVHMMDLTMVISLLQPAPETYDLFDDLILLSNGQIVYHGPREKVLEFFEFMGFKCPERKGVADFLLEVTSKKDQEQYWYRKNQPYRFISVPDFLRGFNSFSIGQHLASDLEVPYEKSRIHPAALVKEKYALSNWELFKACFSRELLLMKRNAFIYVFKIIQITIMAIIGMTVFFRTEMKVGNVIDGSKFLGALFFSLMNVMLNGMAELGFTTYSLPTFYKHRDFLFYPPWAFSLPFWLLRIPLSLIESGIWILLTYYTIGFAPTPSRFFKQFLALFSSHQTGLSLFRLLAAIGRTQVIATALGTLSISVMILFGGFIIDKNNAKSWMVWGFYISPMMYGQNSIVINEFLDERWSKESTSHGIDEVTVGKVLIASRGFYKEEYWYWICIAALCGFTLLFNILFTIALSYLNRKQSPLTHSRTAISMDEDNKQGKNCGLSTTQHKLSGIDGGVIKSSEIVADSDLRERRGMVLPFQPLSLTFNHVNYYVNMPTEMKMNGVEENRLQLLRDVSGAFQPGILAALVGVSGAGKTTLMDVLAGRKTRGYIEGSIHISGYPKKQSTFARVSGYCEQNDIHSPYVTVYESLLYSAWLRLSSDVDTKIRKMFVEEVMELVELDSIRDAIVGLPGVDGLSTEQRKRLTIAVELVANPSIIFMDEPTSGLDARSAAIVMRTVRNTVDTGRTVVCTIHQPSIDIFEAFDELLLMERGGQIIYAGPLGRQSCKLIEYLEAIPGIPKIEDGQNPATWMLEVTAPTMEAQLDINFAEIFAISPLYRRNQELIMQLSTPTQGSEDLHFSNEYSQSCLSQFKACFWKQCHSYWRNTQYNAIRFLVTIFIGFLFGLVFWNMGQNFAKEHDVLNIMGAIYATALFLGIFNSAIVLPVLDTERVVFYRERAAGMYSTLPYAFAQVAIETIYISVQALIYCLPLYSMIGFEWKVAKFLLFYYFFLMCFIYFTLYGMMAVALTPNHHIAFIFVFFFFAFWNLFTGFFIPRPLIPIWWRWCYWASPVAWTMYGLVASLVGDRDVDIEIPGFGNVGLKMLLEERFGYHHDFIPVVVAAHGFWVLIFFFVFVSGIKFLNFQKK